MASDSPPDGLASADGAVDHALTASLDVVLTRYANVVRHALSRIDGLDRITVPQYRCLQALSVTGTALTTQLARQMAVTVPTMTGRIDGLVARGFVERRHDPSSRRQILLILTRTGQAHLELCRRAIDEYVLDLLAGLTMDQREGMRVALRDLQQALDGPPGQDQLDPAEAE